jgi:methyl-accepting chemotaxis protein
MHSKMSIRAKITAVVTLLLVALTGMGLLAVIKMRAINDNTVQIAANWLPSVRMLGELRADVINYRNVLREHMLSETPEEKLAVEKRLAGVLESNTQIRHAYEPMISTPEERALYEEWAKNWEEYRKSSEQVLELSRKAAGRAALEAHALNKSTVNKLSMAADEILKRDIELNNKGADVETRAAADTYASAFLMLAAILGAAILLGAGVSFYVVRDVSRGMDSIVRPMQALGTGDLTADIPHRGEKTEIGVMADALQIFKEALVAKQATDEAASRDAEGKTERGRRVDAITRDFESMIGQIVQAVSSASSQLETSAGTLSATADRSQEMAKTVASASEEASANVQSVASATEELSSSVNEISRRVQESARIASDAVGQARTTTDRVSELSKAASRIGDVVELINTIAGQTNLLALNATIEAAPAAASRWWRPKSRRWPNKPRRPPTTSASRYPASRRRPRSRSARSRRSAAPSKSSRRSLPPLLRRWRSRAPRPRKSPATCSKRPGAPSWYPPISPTCSAAPPRPDRLPRRCSRPRGRCPATATASRSRSASFSARSGLPDLVGSCLHQAGFSTR